MTYEQFTVLNWIWIGIAAGVFVVLLLITAPYGRHVKANWGPLIGNRTGWILMEVVVLIVLYFFVATGSNVQSFANYLVLAFFTFHYLNRSLVFPFRLHTRGKKMPVLIVLMGISFNLVNGFLLGYYFGHFRVYDLSWLLSVPFISGAIIFITGLVINWQSDTILINLRKPGDTGYKIPYGRLFRYVSCPNLLGETIEWCGFAILTWSLPGLTFFIWTCANVTPRAMAHHRWYKKNFTDYPKDRRAIFPFVL